MSIDKSADLIAMGGHSVLDLYHDGIHISRKYR